MVGAAGAGVTRTRWLVVLAGPLAWVIDEGIALVIEADVCSAGARRAPPITEPVLIALAVVALGAMMLAARSALRMRRSNERAPTSTHAENAEFLALAGLLLAGISAFGVLMRLVATFASGPCA